MTEVDKPPRRIRPASGPQLYVLNKHGWLEIRSTADAGAEITNQAADDAIQRSIEEQAEK